DTAKETKEIDTLKLFKVNEIKKSNYFAGGFFPLNSLIHVVVLPADVTKSGWFFNSKSGSKIEAMYLFGDEFSAKRQDLIITLGEKDKLVGDTMPGITEMYVLIGIGAVAAGAAIYYLKGFRVKKNTA
ncbi:MAG TPA: hypothetical protein VIG05_02915, partial [Candidatus Nitrosotenuis sp.]